MFLFFLWLKVRFFTSIDNAVLCVSISLKFQRKMKKKRVQIKENLLQITKWIIIILVDLLNEISLV